MSIDATSRVRRTYYWSKKIVIRFSSLKKFSFSREFHASPIAKHVPFGPTMTIKTKVTGIIRYTSIHTINKNSLLILSHFDFCSLIYSNELLSFRYELSAKTETDTASISRNYPNDAFSILSRYHYSSDSFFLQRTSRCFSLALKVQYHETEKKKEKREFRFLDGSLCFGIVHCYTMFEH